MKIPILVSIPHASTFVPKEIRDKMIISDHDISNHSDLFTDEVFRVKNAYILRAKISRLVVDVNRAPDDIETECQLCIDGVAVRTTPDGKKIYAHPIGVEEISTRIEKYHDTFHDEIEDLVKSGKIKFLVDGHSMWSVGPSALKDAGVPRADICLGNRDFTSCSRTQTYFVKHFFESLGYSVAINDPYYGKYILGFHCHRQNVPGIQIEINRKLFLNEKTLTPKMNKIHKLNREIENIVSAIAEKFC